jgi:2-hydroxychromene-2-carboxylate isomerase
MHIANDSGSGGTVPNGVGMTTIDFWYEFASTYSYPAAMRIERRAKIEGVTLRWRPFLLGPIFSSHGWNDSPFNLYPAKGHYMWRDLERVCAKESLPLRLPPLRFPQNSLKAARIALILDKNERIGDFSCRVYTANFAEQKDISDDETLAGILRTLDLDPAVVVAAANTPKNKAKLKAQTDEAIACGIFGAPSFTIGEELFWGGDRLDDAIAWAKR